MRTSLIITTYNRPKVLALALRSIAEQSVLPDEVIVADDGSTSSTASVVKKLAKDYPTELIHVWQEDRGFRAARVRNLGAARSTGDMLIFIDGDMVLHKDFVETHQRHAQSDAFLHGPRVLLDPALTRRVLERGVVPRISFLNRHVPMSHKFNTINAPWLSRIFTKETTSMRSRACNLSVMRKDFVAVNGFNEDFMGWGEEDSEFAWRLMEYGLRKINIRCGAVQYHLDHNHHNEVANQGNISRNHELFDQIREKRHIWCKNGLSNHIKPHRRKEAVAISNL